MRSAQTIDLADLDLFAHGTPHEAFARLRREDPLHWHERTSAPGFWSVTKHEDLVRVARDPEAFSSATGLFLIPDEAGTVAAQGAAMQGLGPPGLLNSDPPRHTVLRQLVNRGFTPRAVARMEPYIRRIVTGIIDDVCERGECELVADVSKKLPLQVVCELMGVPEGDWDTMFEFTNRAMGVADPEYASAASDQQALQTMQELVAYFMRLCAERRAEPRDDLLSALIGAEIDGERLSDIELFQFFVLLIVAGNETTRTATTGGVLALADHPEQRERLRSDPSLVPTAVEEILRWTSPVVHFGRVATRDVELRGKTISKGDQLILWYPSANRDEDVFGATAGSFLVDRQPNPHLAFGIGEHFCLGANLARLELVVLFEELVRRVPDIEVAGPADRLRSHFINGVKRVRVRFTAR